MGVNSQTWTTKRTDMLLDELSRAYKERAELRAQVAKQEEQIASLWSLAYEAVTELEAAL